MRSNVQTVEDAWALVVAGAEPQAVRRLTNVSPISVKRMRTALKKLTKHAPECAPARMTWKEADHRATALSKGQPQARTIAEAISKAAGTATVPVSVIADALAMANPALPGALMDHWQANNVTRGVRHVETETHA